jgi:hypothetical protein
MATQNSALTSVVLVAGNGPVPMVRMKRSHGDFIPTQPDSDTQLFFGARWFRGTLIPLAKSKGDKVQKPQQGKPIKNGANVTVISLPFCSMYYSLCSEHRRKPDQHSISYTDEGDDYVSYYTIIEWQPETLDEHNLLLHQVSELVAKNIDTSGTISEDLTGNISHIKGTEFPMFTVTDKPLSESAIDSIQSTGIFTLLSENEEETETKQSWAVDVNEKFMNFFMTKPGQQSRNGQINNIFKLRSIDGSKLEPYSNDNKAWAHTAKNILVRVLSKTDVDESVKQQAKNSLAALFGHVGQEDDKSDSVRPVFINKRVPFNKKNLPKHVHANFEESLCLSDKLLQMVRSCTEWDADRDRWSATDQLVKLMKTFSDVMPTVTFTKGDKNGKKKVTQPLTWQVSLHRFCLFRQQLEADAEKLPEGISIKTNLKNQKRAFEALFVLFGNVVSDTAPVKFIDFGVEEIESAVAADDSEEPEELDEQTQAEQLEDDGQDTTEDEAEESVPEATESISTATLATVALLASASSTGAAIAAN